MEVERWKYFVRKLIYPSSFLRISVIIIRKGYAGQKPLENIKRVLCLILHVYMSLIRRDLSIIKRRIAHCILS